MAPVCLVYRGSLVDMIHMTHTLGCWELESFPVAAFRACSLSLSMSCDNRHCLCVYPLRKLTPTHTHTHTHTHAHMNLFSFQRSKYHWSMCRMCAWIQQTIQFSRSSYAARTPSRPRDLGCMPLLLIHKL